MIEAYIALANAVIIIRRLRSQAWLTAGIPDQPADHDLLAEPLRRSVCMAHPLKLGRA